MSAGRELDDYAEMTDATVEDVELGDDPWLLSSGFDFLDPLVARDIGSTFALPPVADFLLEEGLGRLDPKRLSIEQCTSLSRRIGRFLFDDDLLDDADVVALERVVRHVPIGMVSLPDGGPAAATATYSVAKSVSGAIEAVLGAVGLKAGLKYSWKQDRLIPAAAGETRIGYLVIPLDRQRLMVTPKGAREAFPVERFLPPADKAKPGWGHRALSPGEKPPAVRSGDHQPLDGPQPFKESHSVELSAALSLGGQWADSAVSSLEASVGVSGSLTVTAEADVPIGAHRFTWTEQPAGFLFQVDAAREVVKRAD